MANHKPDCGIYDYDRWGDHGSCTCGAATPTPPADKVQSAAERMDPTDGICREEGYPGQHNDERIVLTALRASQDREARMREALAGFVAYHSGHCCLDAQLNALMERSRAALNEVE